MLAAASEPPTVRSLTRQALRRRFAGLPTVFRWSRRSAADVMRSYFRSEALLGAGLVGGPMVWGVSPELPGTGLGALGYAMRHVATVGRPVGGSGALPGALRRSIEHHGGVVRTGTTVEAILCNAERVRGAGSPAAPRSPRRSWCPPPIPAARSWNGSSTRRTAPRR